MKQYGTGDLNGDLDNAPITSSGAAAGRRALNTPAAVADRAITSKTNIGKERHLPMKLRVIERAKANKIHIFNIGPWPQSVNTGSTGTFLIPGCPTDEDYVELLVPNPNTGEMEPPIGEVVEEYVIKSEDEMSVLQDDAWNDATGLGFVQQMLGIGRGCKPWAALTRFGIFATWNAAPTKKERETAKDALIVECKRLYKEAADLFVVNRQLFSKVVRPDVHFVAARVLGLDNPQDSPWMMAADPKKKIKCKMCGRVCDEDVATCEGGHVVNQSLYLELKAADEQLQAAIQASPKKEK